MIRVTSIDGREHYLSVTAIASVSDAGPNWHCIGAYVRTFDGKTIEARESASEIAKMVGVEHAKGAQWATIE